MNASRIAHGSGFRTLAVLTPHVLLTAILATATGCSGADEPSGPQAGSEAPGTNGSTEPTPSVDASSTEPGAVSAVKAYFMSAEKLTPVAGNATGAGVAAAAMELLMAGPDETQKTQGLTSEIPAGTKLLGVRVDNGVATVDMSSEFASGGGSFSMLGRVAQVVFTLTQFSSVDSVLFELEGVPLDVLGGEGVILDEPQTRAGHESFAPDVLVESPTWGATVASNTSLNVTGSANTFEAVFQLQIADTAGNVIRTQRVQATSGTGTRGTFDASISLAGIAPGKAVLVASYLSAKDGSRVVVGQIPLAVR
ncbi:MAG: GerMN domain-containing protein [Coriobacteriia bacterium]|nr:GerMN domain-containing protein [Coriobacteriia bacterium]